LPGHIQQNFSVVGVGEGFDFVDGRERRTRGEKSAEKRQCFGEARGKNGALVDGDEARASRLEIADAEAGGFALFTAGLPLRAIAVLEGRRGARFNGTFPTDAADTAQRLTQDFGFVAKLRRVRHVLILAATATSEMRAWRRNALGGRFDNVQHTSANDFFV